jgi:hypothetical protein
LLKKNEAKKSNAGQVKKSTFGCQKVKKFARYLRAHDNSIIGTGEIS